VLSGSIVLSVPRRISWVCAAVFMRPACHKLAVQVTTRVALYHQGFSLRGTVVEDWRY